MLHYLTWLFIIDLTISHNKLALCVLFNVFYFEIYFRILMSSFPLSPPLLLFTFAWYILAGTQLNLVLFALLKLIFNFC